MASIAWQHYKDTCADVAVASLTAPEREVAQRFRKTRAFVRYHKRKLLDPLLHAGTIGGARHIQFTEAQQLMIEVCALILLLLNSPCAFFRAC
jgi:hypothetical protein